MNAEELLRRLRSRRPCGLRSAPTGNAEDGWPRGDHDLNPELYRPKAPLTPAAVLVPIVLRPPEPTVLLTRRTDHLHDHAGQVSFPGGRIDPEDRDAEAAALRETEEEVGLPREHVEIAGRLDTYVTRTGFEVVPLVGLVTPPFPLAPDSFEVAEVFEVPLAFLLDASNRETQSRRYEGKERFFYVYRYGDYTIWGATAGMLANLEELVNRP